MIVINELTKRYGDVLAVDGLTFTVQPGRVTGFLGPNGSGKSTTLRTLLGLNTPTAGIATINGRRYRDFGTGCATWARCWTPTTWGRTAKAHLAALAGSNGLPKRRVQEAPPAGRGS